MASWHHSEIGLVKQRFPLDGNPTLQEESVAHSHGSSKSRMVYQKVSSDVPKVVS